MQTKKLFFSIILYWFSLYVHIPYQAVYLTSMMVTTGLIGIIAGAYGYAQAAFRIPLSIYVDKLGKQKILMLIGSITPAFAALIRLLADNPQGYFVASLLGGFGASFWVLFIVDFSKRIALIDEKKDASTLINFANQSGILFAYLFSMIAYKYGGMRVLLFASIVGSVTCFLLLISIREINFENKVVFANELNYQNSNKDSFEDEPAKTSENRDQDTILLKQTKNAVSIKSAFFNKNLLKVLPIGFFHFGLWTATIQNISVQRMDQLDATGFQIGLLNVTYMLSTVLMSLVLALLFSKKSKDINCGKAISIAFMLSAFYHFIYMHLQNFVLIGIAQIIAGIYSAIIASCGIKIALETVPDNIKNIAMGIYQTSVALGISLVPTFIGILVDRTSRETTYNLVGISCLFMIIYTFYSNKKMSKKRRYNADRA